MRRGKAWMGCLWGVFVLLSMGQAMAQGLGLCCAKCGGNMPMNIPGGGVPETYEFRFKLQAMYMRMDGLRAGARDLDAMELLGMPRAGVGPSGRFMAVPQSMDMNMWNLSLGYSVSDDWFTGMMLMYQQKRMPMRFNAMMAAKTGLSSYTMRSQGLGDTMWMNKYRLYADNPLIPGRELSLLVALSLPTGSIDLRNTSHPLAMRRGELLPYGMQQGSGSVDPLFALLYQRSRSPWWWGVNASYRGHGYRNRRGYRLGDRYRIDAYLMHQPIYDFLWQVQGHAMWSRAIRGQADEARSGRSGHATQGDAASPYMSPLWDPRNYGGRSASLSLGAQWQPTPLHILELNVDVPLYQRLRGVQLKDRYSLMLTWYMELPTSKSIRHLSSADARQPF